MTDVRNKPVGEELWTLLPTSPDAYLQKLDPVRRLGLVVRLDDRAYRGASFLDDRILTPATQGIWFSWERLEEAAQRVEHQRPLHFIFHTGHVGSTLVSRLLELCGSILSIREPLPLRTLAEVHDTLAEAESLLSPAQFDSLLQAVQRFWKRGYHSTRAVIVKATSTAGRVAVPVLRANPGSRALYLNLKAEPYLATLLAGRNSPDDLRGHAPNRMRRLQASTDRPQRPVHALSIGELAALGWLVESLSRRDAQQACAEHVLALDFDGFLANVGESMARVVSHFELTVEARYLETVGTSPVLNQYSKAPERVFSPADRAALLHDSRERHRDEIARGMAWLEQQARADPAIAALL